MMRWLLTYADLIHPAAHHVHRAVFDVAGVGSQVRAAMVSITPRSRRQPETSVAPRASTRFLIEFPKKRKEKLAEVEQQHAEAVAQVLLREDARGLILIAC